MEKILAYKAMVLAFVLFLFLMPRPSKGEGLNTAPHYGKTPVLFVHGHGENSGYWKYIIPSLVAHGYPREYLLALDIVPNTAGNVHAATEFVEPAVEALLQRARQVAYLAGDSDSVPERVDIVSHSMGALSSRWYAVKLHPERVRTWVSIAGANHGTDVLCRWSDPGAEDSCPAFASEKAKSPIQFALNGTSERPVDETPFGLGMDTRKESRIPPDDKRNILFVTVRLEPDCWIKPERSAVLDGAGGVSFNLPKDRRIRETTPGNYLFVQRSGWLIRKVNHSSILRNPLLIAFLQQVLAYRDN